MDTIEQEKGGTRTVNKKMLLSVMALNGDNQSTLAAALDLPHSAISCRLKGKIDFRVSEIVRIRKRYNLNPQQVFDIFFTDDVS